MERSYYNYNMLELARSGFLLKEKYSTSNTAYNYYQVYYYPYLHIELGDQSYRDHDRHYEHCQRKFLIQNPLLRDQVPFS